MSLKIEGYTFDGPYPVEQTWRLKNSSGCYVILTVNYNNKYEIVDCGESENVRTRVENHDREECWIRNNKNGLYVAVLYCSEKQRMAIERIIRQSYTVACGVR